MPLSGYTNNISCLKLIRDYAEMFCLVLDSTSSTCAYNFTLDKEVATVTSTVGCLLLERSVMSMKKYSRDMQYSREMKCRGRLRNHWRMFGARVWTMQPAKITWHSDPKEGVWGIQTAFAARIEPCD